jgi:hypothetical protein
VDSEQLVIDAANRGIGLAGSGTFMHEMTVNTLTLHGRDLATQLRPGDRPSVLLACGVEVDGGKENPGGVLYLDDRIVVCWLKGTFRPKTELRVVPLADIAGVSSVPRTGNRLTGDRTIVSFRSSQGATSLVLYSPEMDERAVFLAEQMLTDAVTFTWGDDEQVAEREPTA